MTNHSKFRENLNSLTDDQFKQVEQEFAAARAERGGNDGYRRRVENMSSAEFARHVAEVTGR